MTPPLDPDAIRAHAIFSTRRVLTRHPNIKPGRTITALMEEAAEDALRCAWFAWFGGETETQDG